MNLPNKTYDILKWIGITFLPAALTFFGVIAATCDIPNAKAILTIGAAFITFYNTLIGVEAVRYKKSKEE